jgi:hypothetical protein
MARYWYSLVVADGDPRLSSSYQLLQIKPTCVSGSQLCAIYSPEGSVFPRSPISLNLQTYIATALANGIPQPQNPPGSKIFVYLKS